MNNLELDLYRELAGLIEWKPKYGDFVAYQYPPGESPIHAIMPIDTAILRTMNGVDIKPEHCLFLPTIEQLLEILRERGWFLQYCSNFPGVPGVPEGTFAIEITQTADRKGKRHAKTGNTLLEALLRATIAVLKEGKEATDAR